MRKISRMKAAVIASAIAGGLGCSLFAVGPASADVVPRQNYPSNTLAKCRDYAKSFKDNPHVHDWKCVKKGGKWYYIWR